MGSIEELKYPDMAPGERKRLHEQVTFTITCTMKRRWARQFLGAIMQMQKLGSWGSSRNVTIFVDGDGDFRPKFAWDHSIGVSPAEPVKNDDENTYFDAG